MLRKKRLKVLIVESSKVITERLITLVEELEAVKDIFYASCPANVANLIISEQIDVVIWGVAFTDEIINCLADLKKMIPPLTFIVLSNYTSKEYKKRFVNISADHFLSSTEDFDKIPDLIAGWQTDYSNNSSYSIN